MLIACERAGVGAACPAGDLRAGVDGNLVSSQQADAAALLNQQLAEARILEKQALDRQVGKAKAREAWANTFQPTRRARRARR